MTMSNKYEVRYFSEMIRGMALFDEYPTMADARKAAAWLIRSFSDHGFHREAKSVQVL